MSSPTTDLVQTELKGDYCSASGIKGVDGSDVHISTGLVPVEKVASEVLLTQSENPATTADILNSDLTGQAVLNLRPVRPRQTFSEEQVSAMEAMFERKQYLAPPERQALADLVKLTPQQVRVWFQNRRQKIKQYLCLRQGKDHQGQESTDNSVVITPDFLKTLDTQSLQIVMAQAAVAAAVNSSSSSSLSATITTTSFSSPFSSSFSSSSVSSSASSSVPISTNKEIKGDVVVEKDAKTTVLSPKLLIQQQQSAGGVLLLTQPPTAKLSDHSVPLQAVPAEPTNISNAVTSAATSTLAGNTPGPSVVCIAPMLLPALLNGIQLQQGGSGIGAAPTLQLSSGGQLLSLFGQGLSPTSVSSSSSVTGSAAAPAAVVSTTTAAGSPHLVLPIQLDAQSASCLGSTPVFTLPSPAKGSGLDLLKLAQISQLDKTISPLNAGGVAKIKDTSLVSSTTSAGSEVLQQLLDHSADGVKCTWNLNVKPTPTITTFSPVVSGGLVNGTLSPVAQGTSPLVQTSFGRRKRSVFSGFQVEELEKHFQVCSYINAAERERLASKIGLSADQVKVWFQNRRTKKTRTSWRSKDD